MSEFEGKAGGVPSDRPDGAPTKIEKKPAKSRHRVEKIGDGVSHGHDAQLAINVTAFCK
jgi:hypothetical protein